MIEPNHQKWNYFILNINVEVAPLPSNPEEASKKLKGTLSPSFIQDQFPEEYKEINNGEQWRFSSKKFRSPELTRMGINKYIDYWPKVVIFL